MQTIKSLTVLADVIVLVQAFFISPFIPITRNHGQTFLVTIEIIRLVPVPQI